jgi:hypothetical protein
MAPFCLFSGRGTGRRTPLGRVAKSDQIQENLEMHAGKCGQSPFPPPFPPAMTNVRSGQWSMSVGFFAPADIRLAPRTFLKFLSFLSAGAFGPRGFGIS